MTASHIVQQKAMGLICAVGRLAHNVGNAKPDSLPLHMLLKTAPGQEDISVTAPCAVVYYTPIGEINTQLSLAF